MTCDFDGVVIRKLIRHADDRGWLVEVFRQDELNQADHPTMSYVSMTTPGTTRGPHEHVDQTDYFCFMGFSDFRLYLWDNRPDSSTYGQHCRIDIDTSQWVVVMVPPGVVHAYRNTGKGEGLVLNAPNRLYAGEGREQPVDEIRHENQPNSPFQVDD